MRLRISALFLVAGLLAMPAYGQPPTAFATANGRQYVLKCPPAVEKIDGVAYFFAQKCPHPADALTSPGIPLENALNGTLPVSMGGICNATLVTQDPKTGKITLSCPK